MPKSRLFSLLVFGAAFALGVAGCSTDTTTSGESTGSLDLSLELAPGVVINEVRWVISRLGMEDMDGTIDTSAPGATASVEVFGLPPGGGYTVTLTAMVEGEDTPCIGSMDFSVEVGVSNPVMVMLNCKRPERLGGVRVNGKFNVCAELAKVIVSPLQTSVGNDIDLSALAQDVDDDQEAIRYLWTGTGGTIADPTDRITTYTCEEVGDHTIVIRVSDDPEEFGEFCMDEWDVKVACVPGDDPDCEIDDDCDPGEVCKSNICVPDVDCEDDNDCDALEICNDKNECEAVDCKMDSDCGDLEICNDLYMCETVECKIDDDCGTEEICVANVCWGDPDIICDTGICEGNPTAKEECVELFLVCIAEELANEEECIALSILACNECNENSDCETGEVCNDNNVCEPTGEIALPMVVDDNYSGRSAFSNAPDGGPLYTEDNDCPERAGEENGLCHRFIWDGTGGDFTGTFWTDGEGFEDLNGLPVEAGATEVSFYAWGAAGGEVIEFGAGLGESQWDGAQVRIFPTLTTTPTRYSVPLDNLAGYTEVFGPFIWAATSGVEFYVDDIQWIQGEIPTLGPIDFEPGGLGAGFTWGVFENVDNPPLEFINNPDPTGANTSATVAKFTARQAGQPFAGTITQDLPTFTLDASNSCVKIKVWKSVVSDVGLKFEMGAASTGEIKVANTVTDQWEELTFDFSVKIGEPSSTDITGFVVFPDFATRTQENVIYFDDIVFLDSGQCP